MLLGGPQALGVRYLKAEVHVRVLVLPYFPVTLSLATEGKSLGTSVHL